MSDFIGLDASQFNDKLADIEMIAAEMLVVGAAEQAILEELLVKDSWARPMMYEQIKNRAIELLQTESNDRPSFENLCYAESSVSVYYIRDALVRACNELPRPRDRRKAILRKPDFTKAEKEIWRHLRTKTRS